MGNRFVQSKEPDKSVVESGDEWFASRDEPFFHKVWTGGSSGWSTGALADYPDDIGDTMVTEEEAQKKQKAEDAKSQAQKKKEEEAQKKQQELDKKAFQAEAKLKEESKKRKEDEKKRAEEEGATPKGVKKPGEGPMSMEESGASGISGGSQGGAAKTPLGLGDDAAERQTKPLGEPDPVEKEVKGDRDDEDEEEEEDDDENPGKKRKVIKSKGKAR